MIYELYEKHIKKGLEFFPEELCLMLTDRELAAVSAKLVSMLKWVKEFSDIKRFIIHISSDSEYIPLPLSEMEKHASVRVSSSHGDERYGSGALDVLIVIGKCGRQEIRDAVLKIEGRHDPCILTRAVPVVEAVCAVALTDMILYNE